MRTPSTKFICTRPSCVRRWKKTCGLTFDEGFGHAVGLRAELCMNLGVNAGLGSPLSGKQGALHPSEVSAATTGNPVNQSHTAAGYDRSIRFSYRCAGPKGSGAVWRANAEPDAGRQPRWEWISRVSCAMRAPLCWRPHGNQSVAALQR